MKKYIYYIIKNFSCAHKLAAITVWFFFYNCQIYFFCRHSTWFRELVQLIQHWIPEPRNGSAMAAHQVPQVIQRLPVNFHSSNGYLPSKHTINLLELKRLVEPFQFNMHNLHRKISVFINFCVHMCILLCTSVCVSQRDVWLPIDVIIFHLQALISAWVLRYFYYSVCVILCVCVHKYTWMSVWYGEKQRHACIRLWVCELHKIFAS